MRYKALFALLFITNTFCFSQANEDNKDLAELFKQSTEEFFKLNPVSATFAGDMRYNDQFPITFTDSYARR